MKNIPDGGNESGGPEAGAHVACLRTREGASMQNRGNMGLVTVDWVREE